jgi:cold shock protein
LIIPVCTVKFFDARRGFGSLEPDDGGADVFVHVTVVERAGLTTLREGQRVSFDVVTDETRGKIKACNT